MSNKRKLTDEELQRILEESDDDLSDFSFDNSSDEEYENDNCECVNNEKNLKLKRKKMVI